MVAISFENFIDFILAPPVRLDISVLSILTPFHHASPMLPSPYVPSSLKRFVTAKRTTNFANTKSRLLPNDYGFTKQVTSMPLQQLSLSVLSKPQDKYKTRQVLVTTTLTQEKRNQNS